MILKFLLRNLWILLLPASVLAYHYFVANPDVKRLKDNNKELRAQNDSIRASINDMGQDILQVKDERANVTTLQGQIAEERLQMQETIRKFANGLLSIQKQYAQNPTYNGIGLDSTWVLFKRVFDRNPR